jgi:hypothetical protein
MGPEPSVQVCPEKLLSVSAPTDHVMQLLLVKSQLTPNRSARESSASIMVHIIACHGALSLSGSAPAGLFLTGNSGDMKGRSPKKAGWSGRRACPDRTDTLPHSVCTGGAIGGEER